MATYKKYQIISVLALLYFTIYWVFLFGLIKVPLLAFLLGLLSIGLPLVFGILYLYEKEQFVIKQTKFFLDRYNLVEPLNYQKLMSLKDKIKRDNELTKEGKKFIKSYIKKNTEIETLFLK